MAANKVYFGDNLPILRAMPTGSIPLIYIDPPFNIENWKIDVTLIGESGVLSKWR